MKINLKNIFNLHYKLPFALTFLLSILLVAVLLTFNNFSNSWYGTGFAKVVTNDAYYLKNCVGGYLFATFGDFSYILPLITIVWSFKYFFNSPVTLLILYV